MTIKTKLLINVFSWLSFFLIIFAFLYVVTLKVTGAVQRGSLAGRIMVGASDMSTITYDYLMNPEERTRRQWELKHASLRLLIKSEAVGKKEALSLDRIRKNHLEMSLLFQNLVENNKKLQTAPKDMWPVLEENGRRITAGLIARSQTMVSEAHMLTRIIDAEITNALIFYLGLVNLALAIITLVAIAISFLSARDISESIQVLKSGTEVIAAGDLDHRVPVKGRDEIAALARAFNEMADRLRISYVNLQEEVRKKERAREETRVAYSDLERRVEERTREITVINRELLQSGERLKAIVQELESFSYSVSHDLRAPLRAIDGFSNMLARDLGDRLEADSRRKLTVIRENVHKMSQLIDDLLDFSRLGRKPMSLSAIDMENLFRETWRELSALNPERKMELQVGPLLPAYGDIALVRQVVSNLLSNAIKFTSLREAASIEIGCRTEGEENVYFVKDNGAGFDMRYYDKLFGVFQRLHTDSEYPGTGVGLAIVQRIIRRHGGRVWAESVVGEGATFYFTLRQIEKAGAGLGPV